MCTRCNSVFSGSLALSLLPILDRLELPEEEDRCSLLAVEPWTRLRFGVVATALECAAERLVWAAEMGEDVICCDCWPDALLLA